MRRESHASRCASTRTLVTGFGPFGSFAANPSSQLPAECGRPFVILEVSYPAVDRILSQFPAESFDRLVMLGVAVLSQRMRFETGARNWIEQLLTYAGRSWDRVRSTQTL